MLDIKENTKYRDIIAPLFEKQPYTENYVTVSDVKTLVCDKFDSDKVAGELEEKNFNNPDSKYYQMTKEQILESWDSKAKTSMNYGRLLDSAAEQLLEVRDEEEWEMFLLDNNYDCDEKFSAPVDAMLSFLKDCAKKGIEYVGREIPIVYNVEGAGCVKGRIDCLLYNKEKDNFIIIDWKTDDSIDTIPNRWTKPCLGPASGILQLNSQTYTLQVYSYKAALLQTVLKGTDPNKIQCFICNCPKYKALGAAKYTLYPAQFDYNEEQLNKIYSFCIKKKSIINKKKQQQ